MVYVIPLVGRRVIRFDPRFECDVAVLETPTGKETIYTKLHTVQFDSDGQGFVKSYYKDDINRAMKNARDELSSYGVKEISFKTPIRTNIHDPRWVVTNWV